MGAFYGSIHVRTDDADLVHRTLSTWVRRNRCAFFVGPSIRGWVGVYPENAGEDFTISKKLAAKIPADLVHVMVHDDDIFAYCLYRRGKLVDEFNSTPDYFKPVPARQKAKLRGRPELLADFLAGPGAIAEMRQVLDAQPAFKTETLKKFAQLLGLPNAVTSYEYMLSGETEGIEAFDSFLRIPEASPEELERARRRATLDTTLRQSHEAKMLLAELQTPPEHWPVWCTCPPASVLLVWGNRGRAFDNTIRSTSLLRWSAPWSEPPQAVGMDVDDRVHSMAVSPSGLIAEVKTRRHVPALAFSPDERLLAVQPADTVIVVQAVDGRHLLSLDLPGASGIAFHPSGTHLVAGHKGGLAVVDMTSGQLAKVLSVGGIQDDSGLRGGILAILKNPLEFEKKLSKALSLQAKLPGASRAGAGPRIPEHMEELSAPDVLGADRRSVEQIRKVAFSAEGSFLFLATNDGVRQYVWDDVLAARDALPPPLAAADAEAGTSGGWGAQTYGLAHDAHRNLLLFCGFESRLRVLDLATGKTGSLTPDVAMRGISQVAFAGDCSAIFCQPFEHDRNTMEASIQVWDYPKLLAACGVQ
jgi:hypothetical protein